MCRASRALAASIAAFGLSACQLPVNLKQAVDDTSTAPITVVAPASSETGAMPVSLTVDNRVDDVADVEVKTVTLIEVQERSSLVLAEIAKFTANPKSQSETIKSYREAYRAEPNQDHALKLGVALAISGTDENALNEALGLLKRVRSDHADYPLAVVVMDQTRKQLSLLNVETISNGAAPIKTTLITTTSEGATASISREQALRQREIELLERERIVANERGENFRLRQQLAQAEQKLRELAQIEDDLSRPSNTPLP